MGTPLVVEVTAIDKLSAHVANMNKNLTGFVQNTERGIGSLTKGFVTLGSAIGVMAGLNFAKNLVQQSIDYGDNILTMANKTGLTIKQVQELSFVAKQAGTSIESLKRAFVTVSVKAYDSDKAFKAIGIVTRDNNGALKDTGSIFKETLLRLAEIPNVTERAAVANKIFGKTSKEVLGIVAEGKDGIRDLLNETNKYGLVLSDEAVVKLEAAKDAQERWNTQISVMSARLSTLALPLIEKWLSGVNELIGAQERWQKLHDSKVDPRAIALAKEIEAMSLAKTKADEMGFAIVKVNTEYVTWEGTIEEATAVLAALQREQAAILNAPPPAPPKLPGMTTNSDDFGSNKKQSSLDRAKEETAQINDVFSNIGKEFETSELNAIDVFFGDRQEMEARAKETNDLFSVSCENMEKEDAAATDALLESQKEIQDAEKKSAEDKKAAVSSTVSSLQYLAGKHKEFMGAYKLAAIFQIGADTYASAQAAFRGFQKLPQPFGLIAGGLAAATITAAGISRANDVRKQNFASGVRNSGAGTWATFGEHGPENAYLPAGSSVYNSTETKNMMNTSNTTLNVTIQDSSGNITETIRAQLRSNSGDQLVRDLQNKMRRMI